MKQSIRRFFKMAAVIVVAVSTLFSPISIYAGNVPSVWAEGSVSKAKAVGLIPVDFSGYHEQVSFGKLRPIMLNIMSVHGVAAPTNEGALPDETLLNREEVAAETYNLLTHLGKTPPAYSPIFGDLGTTEASVADKIGALRGVGIISGDPGGAFRPKAICTIEEALIMLLNAHVWASENDGGAMLLPTLNANVEEVRQYAVDRGYKVTLLEVQHGEVNVGPPGAGLYYDSVRRNLRLENGSVRIVFVVTVSETGELSGDDEAGEMIHFDYAVWDALSGVRLNYGAHDLDFKPSSISFVKEVIDEWK